METNDSDGKPDVTVFATGSEVSLACAAAALASPAKVRVVSVLSKELLEGDGAAARTQLAGGGNVRVMVAEAGVKQGWEGWVQSPDDIFSIDRFGESGPAQKVAGHLHFTAEALADRIKNTR